MVGLISVALLLGFLIYMLSELVVELSHRKTRAEAEELLEKQRKACHESLEKLDVPSGVSKAGCLGQAKDFRAGHRCVLECEQGRTQVVEVKGNVVDMGITCHTDGNWEHALPTINADGYKVEDLVCHRTPKRGDCVTGPALDAKSSGQPEYLRFDSINKQSFWQVTRVSPTDFWTLAVSGKDYHHCNCGYAEEEKCSFEWSLGGGEEQFQPVESCDEDAADEDRWGTAQVTTLQIKYSTSTVLNLSLADYRKTWWCVDSDNMPAACKLLLTQEWLKDTLNVLDAAGKPVRGRVSQLDVGRADSKGGQAKVGAMKMCQMLRPTGKQAKKFDDFQDAAKATIVTREVAVRMQMRLPEVASREAE